MSGDQDAGRLCFFSSDSYGLAHVIRNTRIANRTVSGCDDLTALIVTGVATDTMPPLVDGCDYFRVPAILRAHDAEHRCVRLRMPWQDLRAMRSQLLAELVPAFGPQVIVMDHLSRNIHEEISALLDRMSASPERPFRILAFNDILNHPDVVNERWVGGGLLDEAARHFDEIWVYGEASFYDWREEYALPPRFAANLRHVGYLSDPVDPEDAAVRRAAVRLRHGFEPDAPVVLVTAGGGHDGGALVDAHLAAIEAGCLDGVHSLLISGPLMPADEQAAFQARADRLGPERVLLFDFVADFEDVLLASDVVVSMGGCTVTEILAAGKRSILVPREQWSSSQQVRADLVAARGWADMVPLSSAGPARLAAAINEALAAGGIDVPLVFRGLQQTSARLHQLTGTAAPTPVASTAAIP